MPLRFSLSRFSLSRSLSPCALLAAALPSLAACAGTASFPPACPEVAIDRDLRDLTHYRPGRTGEAGDLSDLVLDARIASFSGSCAAGDEGQLTTTLAVTVELTRGPAAHGHIESLPLFLAVARGDAILDKQVYPLQPSFPPNTDRVRLTSSPITLSLPVGRDRNGSVYQVWIGFQLTPQELALNRERERH